MEEENLNKPKNPSSQQGVSMTSLRDYIAVEAIKVKLMVWDGDISNKHREAILKDMVERYGNTTVQGGFCKMCYEVADAMLVARSNRA